MDCKRLKHAASLGGPLDDEVNLFNMSVTVNVPYYTLHGGVSRSHVGEEGHKSRYRSDAEQVEHRITSVLRY